MVGEHQRTRAELVVRLAEALAHVALKRWGVYPADVFAWHRSLGGVPVWRSRHPELCAYIERAVSGTALRDLLADGAVSAVVVRALDARLAPVGELVVRVDAFVVPEPVPADAPALLGGVLSRAMQRVAPIRCAEMSFEVAVELLRPETGAHACDATLSMRSAMAGALWAVDASRRLEGDTRAVCSVRQPGIVLDVFCRTTSCE